MRFSEVNPNKMSQSYGVSSIDPGRSWGNYLGTKINGGQGAIIIRVSRREERLEKQDRMGNQINIAC